MRWKCARLRRNRSTTTRAPKALLVALIKPQFEAAPGQVKKGIVRDPAVREKARARIIEALGMLGWRVHDTIVSPLRGGDGNLEFLIGARRG